MDDTTRRVADTSTAWTAGSATDAARSAADDSDAAVDRRTTEIRHQIEQTRDDLSETIDAIQEKLRPRNIVANATEQLKSATTEKVRAMTDTAGETANEVIGHTRDAAGGIMESVKQNPIPAALIGVGAAWLLMQRRQTRQTSGRYVSTDRTYGYDIADDADYGYRGYRTTGRSGSRSTAGDISDAGSRLVDSASEITSRAGEYVSDTTRSVRRTTRRASNRFERMMRENPLLVGAGALVLGAAFGLAVPETERENELMGEARDTVLDRAQDMARTAASQVQNAAGQMAGDVVNKVVSGNTD